MQLQSGIYWIVININHVETFQGTTKRLESLRRDAIAKHIEGSTMTWKQCRKFGWRVKKCKITIFDK